MILHWDEASCQALQFFLALSPFTTLEEHWLDVSIWKDVRKFSKTQFIQLLFFHIPTSSEVRKNKFYMPSTLLQNHVLCP